MADSAFDLGELIHPFGIDDFLAAYWEQSPLVVARDDRGYYDALYTMSDLELALSTTDLQYPMIRLLKDGQPVPPSTYTTTIRLEGTAIGGVAVARQVAAHFDDGATVRLSAPHRHSRSLAGLCTAIEKLLTHPCQANAYLTPKGSQGLTPHYDTHDVFVLQIAGAKHWRLYGTPLPLPLPRQPFVATEFELRDPAQELVLNAGDLLYLPRGTVHDAFTTDELSLHITIGLRPYTWADVFAEAVRCLCQQDARFRKALPPGFATQAGASDQLREEFQDLLETVSKEASLEPALDCLADEFIATRPQPQPRHALYGDNRSGLNLDSVIEPDNNVIFRVTQDGDSISLHFHGKAIRYPDSMKLALAYVTSTPEFAVQSIPGGLDDLEKVIFVHRLVQEGFLTVTRP